jgi:hypothetical protein
VTILWRDEDPSPPLHRSSLLSSSYPPHEIRQKGFLEEHLTLLGEIGTTLPVEGTKSQHRFEDRQSREADINLPKRLLQIATDRSLSISQSEEEEAKRESVCERERDREKVRETNITTVKILQIVATREMGC